MAFIETWDETKPAGTRLLSLGDDDIREMKRALRERFAFGGMYWPSTDDALAGEFSNVRMKEQSANPTVVGNVGYIFTKDVNGITELYYMDSAGTVVQLTSNGKIAASALPNGTVIQIVNTQTGAVSSGSATIPDDDTIPQSSEGNEYMTLSITPSATTNNLLIVVTFCAEYGAADTIGIALFQDSTASALRAVRASTQENNNEEVHTFSHFMAAGTTSATTFKVRAGKSTAGTLTMNGKSTARKYGGVMASSITIMEIKG